ncbi:hypothetical protein J7L49_01705 [Candidatus Bathyarchaeota archaeon]|nr:hypothetical protein [Candidatus Bathyarchaeota archaeon]
MSVKKEFVTFLFTEKIKSDLIITVSLLETLNGMSDEEIVGGEKLLISYFEALIKEVNIAANASRAEGFRKVVSKLEDAIQQTRQHNYGNAERKISEAVTLVTTTGNQAAETLMEKGLI